jgi:hypothetical protein
MAGQRSDRARVLLAFVLMGAASFAAPLFWRDEPATGVVRAAPNPSSIPISLPVQAAAALQPQARSPAQALMTDEGELVVGPELLRTIDAYLVDGTETGGTIALDRFLRAGLSVTAYRQAQRIVADYRIYMKDYDDRLAAQNLHVRGQPVESLDLNRIASWAGQRQRLRQQVFGAEVARLWFDNDDAQLDAVLAELRGQAALPAAVDPRHAPSPDTVRRERAEHAAYVRQVIDNAVTGFRERAGR